MVDLYSIAGVFENLCMEFPFGGFFLFGKEIGNSPFDDGISGDLVDFHGKSVIHGRMRVENSLEFRKKYSGRDSYIDYRFSFDKDRKLWVGNYKTSGDNEGKAECIVNLVSENFLLNRLMIKTL